MSSPHRLWRLKVLFYFEGLCRVLSLWPPPKAYALIPILDPLFKDLKVYPFFLKPGICLQGEQALQKILGLSPPETHKVVRKLLCFETRVVIENFWIYRGEEDKLVSTLLPEDLKRFRKTAGSEQVLWLTLHTFYCIPWLMALIAHGLQFSLILGDPRSQLDSGPPFFRSARRFVEGILQKVPAVKIPGDRPMDRARELLREGWSLMITPDVIGYKRRGLALKFFNQKIWFAGGSLKLAREFELPTFWAFSYTPSLLKPYRLKISPLKSAPSRETMQEMVDKLEIIIKKWPFIWPGWLYLHLISE